MRSSCTLTSVVILILSAVCVSPLLAGEVPADLLLINGSIYTVEPSGTWVEAVAVRNGRIQFVGTNEGAAAFQGPQTEIIDLQGRMAMPGIHDTHIHILEAFHLAFSCLLPPFVPLKSYVPILSDCEQFQICTDWVIGFGHSISTVIDHLSGNGTPPNEIMDMAIPDRPAVIMELTSHSVWVNSAALAELGYDSSTPDPPGGAILHDATTGEPNGILLDGAGEIAMDLAMVARPCIRQLNYQALLSGMAAANQNGITSVCDARVYWQRDFHKAYERAQQQGTLTVRAVLGLWAYPYLDDDEQIATLTAMYNNDPQSLLRFSQVKMYADGEISHTSAALLDPYHSQTLPDSTTGLQYFDEARMTKYLTQLDEVGFDFHIHTIGDRGVHESLNAVETAQQSGGTGRHRLTHLYMIQPDDVSRFAELDVTADFQMADNSVFPRNLHALYGHELGHGRINERMLLLRSVYDTGARVVLSSDFDVGDLSPFAGMARSISRGAESLPDLDAAVRAYTIDAAYVMRQERLAGSIEVSKFADIIVLDQNIFEVSPAQIAQTDVLLTLLGGEEVWRDPGF